MGNNKRKYIHFFIFLIGLILIPSINVNAVSVKLSPPEACFDYTDGSTQCGTTITETWWDKTVYKAPFKLYNMNLMPISMDFNFQWPDAELCVGEDILISGKINIISDFFDTHDLIVNIYNNDTQGTCTYTKESSNVYAFTCSAQGGGATIFTFHTNNYVPQNSYDVSIDQEFNLTCNATNSTIITNDNKNTQDIINNQDKNAVNIMDNNNYNTDRLIDSQNKIDQSIDETNDYLKDDTDPNADISALGNVQGLLPAGPVDSLLNIPFMFLSVLTTSMGGVCVPMEFTFVFDSKLALPCFSEQFYNNVPDLLLNFLSLIPGAWILIKYFKHLYLKVERAVSMDSNADDQWGVI